MHNGILMRTALLINLNFNDGIINVNGGEGQEVKLGDINGSGGTVNMLTSSDLKPPNYQLVR